MIKKGWLDPRSPYYARQISVGYLLCAITSVLVRRTQIDQSKLRPELNFFCLLEVIRLAGKADVGNLQSAPGTPRKCENDLKMR
jgi:hypothetical protein